MLTWSAHRVKTNLTNAYYSTYPIIKLKPLQIRSREHSLVLGYVSIMQEAQSAVLKYSAI